MRKQTYRALPRPCFCVREAARQPHHTRMVSADHVAESFSPLCVTIGEAKAKKRGTPRHIVPAGSPVAAMAAWIFLGLAVATTAAAAGPVPEPLPAAWHAIKTFGSQMDVSIGVLFGCFARKIDGPGLAGGLIIRAINFP